MVTPKKPKGSGRVRFLALKDDIETKLQKGMTFKMIFEELAKQLDMSYVQFIRYIRKDIYTEKTPVKAKNHPPLVQPKKELEESDKKPVYEKTIKTFKHNPTPSIDDLK